MMSRLVLRMFVLSVVVSSAALSIGCESAVGVGIGVGNPYGGYGSYGPWGPGTVITGGPVVLN